LLKVYFLNSGKRPLFFKGSNPDQEEIEEMVDEADEDGSGSINFQEFVGLMLKKQEGGQTKEEVKQVIFFSI
jgi:Ca2+-binding EF-hand superfamily protein